MLVRDLIEELQNLDPNLKVLLQKDAEGNGFEELEDVDSDSVAREDEGEYEVYSTEWSADDCCLEEDEWKELKLNNKVVVLVP